MVIVVNVILMLVEIVMMMVVVMRKIVVAVDKHFSLFLARCLA
jgi:hypothetical protein